MGGNGKQGERPYGYDAVTEKRMTQGGNFAMTDKSKVTAYERDKTTAAYVEQGHDECTE